MISHHGYLDLVSALGTLDCRHESRLSGGGHGDWGLCTTVRHSPSHVSAESVAVVLDIHSSGWARTCCCFLLFSLLFLFLL